jgi:hypothetical protein
MTIWKVPGARLLNELISILEAKKLGFSNLIIEFDPELENQLFLYGFKVKTLKLTNNYYTVVTF